MFFTFKNRGVLIVKIEIIGKLFLQLYLISLHILSYLSQTVIEKYSFHEVFGGSYLLQHQKPFIKDE